MSNHATTIPNERFPTRERPSQLRQIRLPLHKMHPINASISTDFRSHLPSTKDAPMHLHPSWSCRCLRTYGRRTRFESEKAHLVYTMSDGGAAHNIVVEIYACTALRNTLGTNRTSRSAYPTHAALLARNLGSTIRCT